jgi:heparan-alpha-glucosaminide N-acetyltransferase
MQKEKGKTDDGRQPARGMMTRPKPLRITSIDAYRGLVMFLLLAEALHLPAVAKQFPDSRVWQTIQFHTSHVEWAGCSLHDLIQPSFSFLVGVALPFSIASRVAKGQGFWRMFVHAVGRALLLIALGVFLRSQHTNITNFTFEDTLTQIGLGYVFLFVLGYLVLFVFYRVASIAWLWIAVTLVLVGYWAAFALYPLPASDFDYASVGVKSDFPHYTGFLAHWNKNSNAAWAFDTWFLNLFGREKPFAFNGGGYATLSFIPTLATMILGLIAGIWLKDAPSRGQVLFRLFLAGVVCLGAGYGLEVAGVNPIVKRIWTPAWTLYSGGICFLILLGFSLLFDGKSPLRLLAFPLVVIGANSIFIYCAYETVTPWIEKMLTTHLALPERHWGFHTFELFGPEYESIVRGALVIVVFWLVLLWMYAKRIFIKI